MIGESKFTAVRTCAILVLIALTLGPSASYIAVCLFSLFAAIIWFSADFERVSFLEICGFSRNTFIVLAAYTIVSALVICFSSYAEVSFLGELKWVAILMGLLVPAHLVLNYWRLGAIERAGLILLIALLGFQIFLALQQSIAGMNMYRSLIAGNAFDTPMSPRSSGMLRNPITFGQLMGLFFWISVSGGIVAKLAGKRGYLILAVVISLGCFISVIASQSRGAWLALAVSGLISIFLVPKPLKKLWISAIVAISLIGSAWILFDGGVQKRFLSAFDSSQEANSDRIKLWRANWEILKEYPLGIGYNANDKLMGEKFDELGFEKNYTIGNSHNEYVEIAVGSGWIGLSLYFVFVGATFLMTLNRLRHLRYDQDSWSTFLLLGSLMVQAFVAFAVLTDQINTPLRIAICFAWAIGISASWSVGATAKRECNEAASSETF